jgi:hypothetical protein
LDSIAISSVIIWHGTWYKLVILCWTLLAFAKCISFKWML